MGRSPWGRVWMILVYTAIALIIFTWVASARGVRSGTSDLVIAADNGHGAAAQPRDAR